MLALYFVCHLVNHQDRKFVLSHLCVLKMAMRDILQVRITCILPVWTKKFNVRYNCQNCNNCQNSLKNCVKKMLISYCQTRLYVRCCSAISSHKLILYWINSTPHYILEVSNFNFRYVRLCDLDILRRMADVFANSGDPDQTLHSVISDLGLHCLSVTLLGVSRLKWVGFVFVKPCLHR